MSRQFEPMENRSSTVIGLVWVICEGCITYSSGYYPEQSFNAYPPQQVPASQPLQPTAQPADHRCFVVFVHGSGQDPADQNTARQYWTSPLTGQSFIDTAAQSQELGRTCESLSVAYNGNTGWMDDGTSNAAGQIAQFLEQRRAPPNSTILIGHSMGGLVIRSMLNILADNPNPAIRSFLSTIRYAITIATPHSGAVIAQTAAAPSLAPTFCARVVSSLYRMIEGVPAERAYGQMSPIVMSAYGRISRDSIRRIPIFTIGTSSPNSRIAYRSIASQSVSSDIVDRESTLDQHSVMAWRCAGLRNVPGDGCVSVLSAHAQDEAGNSLPGCFVRWFTIENNHNRVRYGDELGLAQIYLHTPMNDPTTVPAMISRYGYGLDRQISGCR